MLLQWFPLSPSLFVLYISPTIPTSARSRSVNSICVDDNCMLHGVSSLCIAINGLENRLDGQVAQAIPLWLTYLLAKAKFPHLIPKTSSSAHPHTNITNVPLRYQQGITYKDNIKILAITINGRLTFREHTSLNKAKALNML